MNPSVLCGSDCALATVMYTFFTMYAVFTVVHDLHPGKLGLRIGAPFALKRTSLQKYSGPYTGAVVDGKLLNIKDKTARFHLEKLLYSDASLENFVRRCIAH